MQIEIRKSKPDYDSVTEELAKEIFYVMNQERYAKDMLFAGWFRYPEDDDNSTIVYYDDVIYDNGKPITRIYGWRDWMRAAKICLKTVKKEEEPPKEIFKGFSYKS